MAGFDLQSRTGVDLYNRTAATLALSTTAAQTPVLSEGCYMVWCAAIAYLRVTAPATVGVTAANGYLLRADVHTPIVVREGHKIEAIAAAATPTLVYHKVG